MRGEWLGALLLMAVGLAGADEPFPRPYLYGCGIIPSRWLGFPWDYNDRSYARIAEMGGTASGAGGLGWKSLERYPGIFDWFEADYHVDAALRQGLVLFGFIGTTPYWALPPELQDDPNAYWQHPPMEEYAGEFAHYCRTVAARYAGRIDRWTFWNEPNGCGWVRPGCSNSDGYPLYTRWLKRAYVALKEGNPNCKVAAGNLDYHEGVQGWRYVEGMYNEGAKGYFDAIAIHPYASTGIFWAALRDTRNVMVARGDADKPIWLTEYGWQNSATQSAADNLVSVLTELVKPEYSYVEMANYLVITDLPDSDSVAYGLCNRQLTPRPIWYAYRNFPKGLPTRTPTPTAAPATPTATPAPGQLRNGDFEDGLVLAPTPFQDHPKHPRVVGAGWQPWGTGWWKESGPAGYTWRSATRCQTIGTNSRSLDNALLQTVRAVPGTRYRFSAWVMLEGPLPGSLWCRVGIDPTGGTDPNAASVVYGPRTTTQGVWENRTVEAEALTGQITVFVRCKTDSDQDWPWCHIDDAALSPAAAAPTETPSPPPALIGLY